MLEILDTVKKLLGIYTNPPELISRKRRLSRDPDILSCKMRRLDDFTMPQCSSPLEDLNMPSSSRNTFKKPSFPIKSYLRPVEVIDLSDEEDDKLEWIDAKKERRSFLLNFPANDENDDKSEWIDVTREKRNLFKPNNLSREFKDKSEETPRSSGWINMDKAKKDYLWKQKYLSKQYDGRKKISTIVRKAKDTINNTNNFFSSSANKNSVLNESVRITEKERYKKILDSLSKANFGILSSRELNGTEKKVREDKFPEKKEINFADIYRKRFEEVHGLKTIDLTDEANKKSVTISIDSDSDSDVKFISQKKLPQFNSLQKRLEIEPVTNENWITEWTNEHSRTNEERKKQILDVQNRRDKFRDLNKHNVQSRLEETLKSCLRIQEVVLLDEEEEELKLPELTQEQEHIVSQALKSGPANHVFIDKFNLRITRNDLQTLRGLNWLNDEVINFYTNLISERGNGTNNPDLPKVHSMNTFFYPKLITHGYSALRRWTKKVDVFAQDMIVIPIHLGVHWCLAIIDFRDKHIRYYDSMGSENQKCVASLMDYLHQEHLDKKKTNFDSSGWKTVCVRDIPQQMNGSDCGMFACMYAEFLTRNKKILFTQEHMPYFRRKMVYEIITGQLLMKK